MSAGDVFVIPCLSDNYTYLVRCHETGMTAIVDPGEAGPVVAELEDRGWSLDIVINTHHHNDHIGGNGELITKAKRIVEDLGGELATPAQAREILQIERR